MDCFMGEFWNSYSNAENAGLEAFMLSGGGGFLVDTRGTGLTQTMMWLTIIQETKSLIQRDFCIFFHWFRYL